MYAIVMAGGGGTRLHPLSRPERPKPFLPLLGEQTLIQATVDRLPTTDVTVVTDARYESLVRDQLPDVHLLLEPRGRNTAAAIALATVAVDRPDDDVMLVVPADAHVTDPDRYRDVLARAADGLATGAFDLEAPLVTLGTAVDRVATDYGYLIPDLDRHDDVAGLAAYPLRRFEEKPNERRALELRKEAGVAWNAGIFLWRRRAIRAALERYTSLIQLIEPSKASTALLAHAYEQLKPVSIDYAVMEGAASNGEVVMGSMDVGWSDLGTWSALLEAIGAGGHGAVIQAGETVAVSTDDRVVRRTGGKLGIVRPSETGSMTASQTLAVLRDVTDLDPVVALLERCMRADAVAVR